jgi:ADP-ribose pyrophosphatase YjhB (NUDIX family)
MRAKFCQQCGTEMKLHEIDRRLVPVCPNCGFTAWSNPVVATMVVIETPGGLILGRRSIEPGYGLWCLPGGFVNEDEAPAEAAMRECLEEIQAKVRIERLLDVYHIVRGDGRGMVGIAYVAGLEDGEAPTTGQEMLEVGLFAPDNLPELAFSSHRRAIADWAAGRAAPASMT